MGSELSIRAGINSTIRQVDTILSKTNLPNNGVDFFMARVSFILLDNSNKDKFDKYGGWKAIGTIECKTFINNDLNEDIIVALPVNANVTTFPLINEIVLVLRSITYSAQKDEDNYIPQYYYTNIVPGWNSPEHNAIPNKRSAELNTGIFTPKGTIRRLIKAPGDITVEGRSGNIIRLGSSIDKFNSPYKGANRAPLLSIVNGIYESGDNKVAVYENINLDGSSLYMLSGQSVAFSVSSLNFDSFNYKVEQTVTSDYIQPTAPSPTVPDNIEEVVDEAPIKKEVVNKNKDEVPKTESVDVEDNLELADPEFPEDAFDLTDGDIIPYNDVDAEAFVEEEKLPDNKKTNSPREVGIPGRATPPVLPRVPSVIPAPRIPNIPRVVNPPRDSSTDRLGQRDIEKPIDYVISPTIKWELQQSNTWCYVTSVAMVLKSYGIASATQSAVATCNNSSGNLRSETAAKKFNVSFYKEALPTGKSKSYDRIVAVCKERTVGGVVKPFVIERLGSSGFKNHFVVAVGLTPENRVILFDPASSKNSKGTFLNIKNLKESGGSLRFFDK